MCSNDKHNSQSSPLHMPSRIRKTECPWARPCLKEASIVVPQTKSLFSAIPWSLTFARELVLSTSKGKFECKKWGDVFLILTQSRSYQTSEDLSSMGLQNLIYPCVLFPEELETITMINEKEKKKKRLKIQFLHGWKEQEKVPMCGLQIMPQYPCQLVPSCKRHFLDGTHLQWCFMLMTNQSCFCNDSEQEFSDRQHKCNHTRKAQTRLPSFVNLKISMGPNLQRDKFELNTCHY